MKILRLYYKLPPENGGMEKHIYYLSKFQNVNHHVSIYFNQGSPISSNDKKIFPLLNLTKITPLFIGIFIFYFCVVFKLFFDRKKFDVIHIHGDWSSLIFIKILKNLTNATKVVYTNHGIVNNCYQHRKFLPITLKNIDLIFTTGNESATMIKKMINRQVVIQPSGINEVFFKQSRKYFDNVKFRVVTVANLVAVKNIAFVLEIAKDLSNMEFTIVGEGEEREMLINTMKINNLQNVKFVGFKSPEKIKEIFDESDCFLLTSLAEGTPTSTLEAVASGLPIISSNAGGIDNIIIDNVNGFVIKNLEKSNYTRSLMMIKEDLNLRKTMHKNNREIAENFRWDIVADRITRLTKECLYGKN